MRFIIGVAVAGYCFLLAGCNLEEPPRVVVIPTRAVSVQPTAKPTATPYFPPVQIGPAEGKPATGDARFVRLPRTLAFDDHTSVDISSATPSQRQEIEYAWHAQHALESMQTCITDIKNITGPSDPNLAQAQANADAFIRKVNNPPVVPPRYRKLDVHFKRLAKNMKEFLLARVEAGSGSAAAQSKADALKAETANEAGNVAGEIQGVANKFNSEKLTFRHDR